MKKLIVLLVFTCVAAWGYSQEDTQKDVSVFKETMAGIGNAFVTGEAFQSMSEFSYGFLKQGVNTAAGVGGALIELPSNLVVAFKEYSDVNSKEFLYWGEYTFESIGDFVDNVYQNVKSGDPERIGEAAFDVFYVAASAKDCVKRAESLSKVGKDLANKYGYKHHYTSAEGAKGIQKTGLKLNSEGKAYTTYDGSLSGIEAQNELALLHPDPPTWKVTFDRGVKPDKIGVVEPKGGRSGGGIEQIYYENIPADKIISVDPIPKDPIMTTKAARIIGETSNSIASYAAPVVGPVIAKMNTLGVDNMDNNEGGHKLDSRINIVVFIEDSINQGNVWFFEKDDVKYIGINTVDIDKLTPQFYQKLSGNKCDFDFEDEKASDRNRSREESIPMENRTQRGL